MENFKKKCWYFKDTNTFILIFILNNYLYICCHINKHRQS